MLFSPYDRLGARIVITSIIVLARLWNGVNTVKYWYRILTIESFSVIKCVYNELYCLQAEGHSTWCCRMLRILNMHGHCADCENKLICVDISAISRLNIIKTCWRLVWFSTKTVANPILRTQNGISDGTVPYLCKSPSNRRPLIKFRTSSHMIRIETGRCQTPKLKP